MSERIDSYEAYQKEYEKSVKDPEGFWEEKAERFIWRQKWDNVLRWNFEEPNVKWFEGGKLNITENILEQNVKDRGDQTAILWEPNDPQDEVRKYTYTELHDAVCRFANVLKKNGVGKGDRVCIYMHMVPELPIALLACARIGAIHSVVFAGFSAKALADRIDDANCKVLLTADGGHRGDKYLDIKSIVDDALEQSSSVETCIVLKHSGEPVEMKEGRDVWWNEELKGVSSECDPEIMDAEDPLFILYTSGSTGKPKGIVHTTGGYMVYTEYSFRNVFQYEAPDVYWCTADIGWVTGHSYIVYGPLLAGATTVVYEGVPTWPDPSRFWQIVEKHGVHQFYTAPTAIRALISYGKEYTERHDMSSLKVLGSVGEPINEEAWNWYYKQVGKERCPIVDTWWQTETGGIMISALGDKTPQKATYATLPLPGIQPALLDADGNEIEENGVEGNLCIKFPWPSMLRTVYGDHERCRRTYFSTYKGYYFTEDSCKRDVNGLYRITGRVDDVINVSGHRLGTAEIEDAIDLHADVVETAVVGYPHEIKGEGIYAFIICEDGDKTRSEFEKEILEKVKKEIGPIAKPDQIQVVKGLPKTRSGKIMRRILRKLAEGKTDELGDTSTLVDPEVIDDIKRSVKSPS